MRRMLIISRRCRRCGLSVRWVGTNFFIFCFFQVRIHFMMVPIHDDDDSRGSPPRVAELDLEEVPVKVESSVNRYRVGVGPDVACHRDTDFKINRFVLDNTW